MLAWTPARGQAAELPTGQHWATTCLPPWWCHLHSVPEAACMRSLTSHGTQDWSGSLWLPCSHECKAAAGSRTHSGGRCHRGARACQEAGMGWQAWTIQVPPGWSSGSSHSWSSLHSFHFLPIPAGLDVLGQGLGSAPTPETSFLCGAHGCGLAPRSLCLDAGKPELALSEAV